MKNYEVMFIVKPTIEDEAANAILESVKSSLESNGAKIKEVKNLGRKELAYEVRTFNNGNYFYIALEGEAKAVKEFDRIANINEDIIRHIVVNKEK